MIERERLTPDAGELLPILGDLLLTDIEARQIVADAVRVEIDPNLVDLLTSGFAFRCRALHVTGSWFEDTAVEPF